MSQFKVEMLFASGWDDAGWTDNGVPMRFRTMADAEEAIDEFIIDQHEAVQNGHMEDPYLRSEFRAVPVEDGG